MINTGTLKCTIKHLSEPSCFKLLKSIWWEGQWVLTWEEEAAVEEETVDIHSEVNSVGEKNKLQEITSLLLVSKYLNSQEAEAAHFSVSLPHFTLNFFFYTNHLIVLGISQSYWPVVGSEFTSNTCPVKAYIHWLPVKYRI